MLNRDSIIERLKNSLQNEANKIEGSFAIDNINSIAEELEVFYGFVLFLDQNHYVDTAEGEYLDKKAADYGLVRKKATKARGTVKVSGAAGVNIPKGTIFLSDTLSFVSLSEATIPETEVTIEVEAVEAGALGNLPIGSIIRTEETIPGINGVSNQSAFTGGSDIETDELFRGRLLFKIQNPATSGNVNHYKIWASEVDGVGKVRVFPLHAGPGTVKVSVLDNNSAIATPELLQKVKNHIDPDVSGDGFGRAPIGAKLTVSTATAKNISISVHLQLIHPERLEETRTAIQTAIQNYFKSVSYNERVNYVSAAKLGDILFDHENVEDFELLMLNNDTKNIPIGQEEIPILSSLEVS